MASPLTNEDDYTFTYQTWSLPKRVVGETSWSYKTTVMDEKLGTMTVERVLVAWNGHKWVEIETKEKAAPTNEYGPVEL